MKRIITFFLFLPLFGSAHPGIAIVIDSKGNIYYSDLQQVWKITNGIKSIIVPNVHTHELHIDDKDNLYGEHLNYEGDVTKKFSHYLWMLKPSGILDTLVSPRQAFVHNDYSLARDKIGNEYYLKQSDTSHIFKKFTDGKEIIFVKGNFSGVTWLHPQKNGSLLFVLQNDVYRINAEGKMNLITNNIGNKTPSFKFSGNSITVWGIWEDNSENVYVAVFSDQTIKKINKNGKVSEYYKSIDNWAPTHGVFDNKNQLWVLECSDKNEIRAVLARSLDKATNRTKNFGFFPFFIICFSTLALLFYYLKFRTYRRST